MSLIFKNSIEFINIDVDSLNSADVFIYSMYQYHVIKFEMRALLKKFFICFRF